MGASPYRGRLGASLTCGADVTSGGISRPAAWHAAWQLGKWAMPTWVSLTFLVELPRFRGRGTAFALRDDWVAFWHFLEDSSLETSGGT
jgi:hypothetical protein